MQRNITLNHSLPKNANPNRRPPPPKHLQIKEHKLNSSSANKLPKRKRDHPPIDTHPKISDYSESR